MTSLVLAIMYGRDEWARALLRRGVNVNIHPAPYNASPLAVAVVYNHHDLAWLLLQHGATPFACNISVMYWAVRRRWLALARHVASAFAGSVDVRHRDKATPLWLFAASRDIESCDILLSLGADPSLTGPDGTLPVRHLPCLERRLDAAARRAAIRRRDALLDIKLWGHRAAHADSTLALVTDEAVTALCDDVFRELCRFFVATQ
jgi:ankyrin repeat protein